MPSHVILTYDEFIDNDRIHKSLIRQVEDLSNELKHIKSIDERTIFNLEKEVERLKEHSSTSILRDFRILFDKVENMSNTYVQASVVNHLINRRMKGNTEEFKWDGKTFIKLSQ